MPAFAQKQPEPSLLARSTAAPLGPGHHMPTQRALGANAEGRKEGAAVPASTRFARDFSRIPAHAPAPGGVQSQLSVNAPGDRYEQEAERISEQVMRTAAPLLQRTGPEGQAGAAGPGQERLQRSPAVLSSSAGSSAAGLSAAPSSVHEVLGSPGQPLDAAARTFMEPRFGHDFSRVRIHTDSQAAQSAGQIQASAYAVGDHIVFAEGRFAPSTHEGSRLLAHELAHVVQSDGQNAVVRRAPDAKALADEARLRVRIIDALEATKQNAVNTVASAIERGDRAYLEGLKLTPGQVNDLLNHTPQYNMEFGTAVERQIEQTVRADPFLSKYVKRGPTGRVPRGVGKPDWKIETPSSSMPVELTTREQLEQKLEMWRRQSPRGKAKWYVEKSVNLVYDIPPTGGAPGAAAPGGTPGGGPPGVTPGGELPGLTPGGELPGVKPGLSLTELPAEAAGALTQEIAQVVGKVSRFRTAGRFLAREAPGLLLQVVLMVLFPPGVNIHNDKAEELSQTKLDPAVQDALEKQAAVYDKLLAADISKSIYANVTARLDYSVGGNKNGDLVLNLKDVEFLDAQITTEDVSQSDPKFNQTGSLTVSKQITYSLLLYEPDYVTRDKEWAAKQQKYQECLRQYGTGSIPPAAGAEAASQNNPEEGPCIPPRMQPMEGP